jgi:hypothetical protein
MAYVIQIRLLCCFLVKQSSVTIYKFLDIVKVKYSSDTT